MLPISANSGPLVNQLGSTAPAKPSRPRSNSSDKTSETTTNSIAEESKTSASASANEAKTTDNDMQRERKGNAPTMLQTNHVVHYNTSANSLDAKSATQLSHQTASQVTASPHLAYAAHARTDARSVLGLLRG